MNLEFYKEAIATSITIDHLPVCRESYARFFFLFSLASYFFFLAAITIHSKYGIYRKRRKLEMAEQMKETEEITISEPFSEERQEIYIHWSVVLYDTARNLIGGKTICQKAILMVYVILACVQIILYVFHSNSSGLIQRCVPISSSSIFWVDIFLNLYFSVYFIIRFIAASDKMSFMFQLATIVDFFTLPPAMLFVYIDRHWMPGQFLLMTRMLKLPELIALMSSNIRFYYVSSLVVRILVFTWTAASLLHVADLIQFDNEDPHHNNWLFGYWLLTVETISTVGYGINIIETKLGKVLVMILMVLSIVMYSTYISLLRLIVTEFEHSNDTAMFVTETGKQHVILCGHITYETVSEFLSDFLHEDRCESSPTVVILNKHHTSELDLQLRSLLKKFHTKVKYCFGSAMDAVNLKNVQVSDAEACIVLADKHYQDSDAEDAANIMRVVSIKNFSRDTRVIVEILLYKNKSLLLNIPGWDIHRDDAVCVSELALGLIAQQCLTKGLPSLIINLFTMKAEESTEGMEQWEADYNRGAGMELYTHILPISFEGLDYGDAIELCFCKLNILLIGVECYDEKNREFSVILNPKDKIVIEAGMTGFFIADCEQDVRRVLYFCHHCHKDVEDAKQIKWCNCPEMESTYSIHKPPPSQHSSNDFYDSSNGDNTHATSFESIASIIPSSLINVKPELLPESTNLTDSTGLYYWCPSTTIDKCIIHESNSKYSTLSNHVVVCVYADSFDPAMGLRSLVMPLRSSSLKYDELSRIVFIGHLSFISREWDTLRNFPEISIVPSSPSNRKSLRIAKVDKCKMCIILSAKNHNDIELLDKEAIIGWLSVRSMDFSNTKLSNPKLPMLDLCTRNRGKQNNDIPLIAQLRHGENVVFLDSRECATGKKDFFMTKLFAGGSVFSNTVLNSLICTSYFNHTLFEFIRSLITGPDTFKLEACLAEGVGMQRGTLKSTTKRSCIILKSCLTEQLFTIAQSGNYEDIFLYCLKELQLVCLGLYRLINESESSEESNGTASQDVETPLRFVITNPPTDFKVYVSDQLFLIEKA